MLLSPLTMVFVIGMFSMCYNNLADIFLFVCIGYAIGANEYNKKKILLPQEHIDDKVLK